MQIAFEANSQSLYSSPPAVPTTCTVLVNAMRGERQNLLIYTAMLL